MKSDKMIWETFGAKYQDDRRTLKGGRLIAGYMGIVMILAGIITMLPLFTLFFYPEEIGQAQYFVAPGVSAILAGYLMSLVLRGRKAGRLEKNQEMIVVLGTWIIVIFVTAMPFVLTGNYTVTQAVFETTSGLSTTGLTVVNTGTAPRIFLIHRTVLLFFGGIGLVLVMTSVLSDVYGMRLYHAEGHKNYFDDSWAPALDCIADLYQKEAFPKDTMTISEDDIRLMFKEGKAAMMFNGSWCVSALEDNPDMRLISMPALPGGKGGESCALAGFGSGWFLSREASERSEESLKLLKYLTSPEIMQRFIAVGGSSAVECQAPEGASELMKSAVLMLNKATYTDTAIDSQVSREAWMAIADDGTPYLVEGKKSSLDLLAEARKIQEAVNR